MPLIRARGYWQQTMKVLLEDDGTCYRDLVFACKDGNVKAHRFVMAAAFPFFRQLLLPAESSSSAHIVMPKAKLCIIRAIIRFAYTGLLQAPDDLYDELLDWLKELRIDPKNIAYMKPREKKYSVAESTQSEPHLSMSTEQSLESSPANSACLTPPELSLHNNTPADLPNVSNSSNVPTSLPELSLYCLNHAASSMKEPSPLKRGFSEPVMPTTTFQLPPRCQTPPPPVSMTEAPVTRGSPAAFRCPICRAPFRSQVLYDDHVENLHPKLLAQLIGDVPMKESSPVAVPIVPSSPQEVLPPTRDRFRSISFHKKHGSALVGIRCKSYCVLCFRFLCFRHSVCPYHQVRYKVGVLKHYKSLI